MPQLRIAKFSCIEEAELDLKPLTVLIGPQASGKSVISKLLYFFVRLQTIQYESAEEGNSLRLFHADVARRFSEWFPPSAWGSKAFEIVYTAGPVQFTISRKQKSRDDRFEAKVSTSEFFAKHYEQLTSSYRKAIGSVKDEDDMLQRFDRTWPIQRESMRNLRAALGDEFVFTQFFVPAGRSFYTTLGKAVAILEHGAQVDEITKQFGRIYTAMLDARYRPYPGARTPARLKEFLSQQKKTAQRLFGGELRMSTNDTHVMTPDGRKIPFSTLSSGQQEMLPLILVLQRYSTIVGDEDPSRGLSLLFVEEPEAHLFPASQGLLTELLVEVANYSAGSGRLLITTHSPYVLSKLNNMIKAYQVAQQSEETAQRVRQLVPESAWLSSDAVQAYALENGKLSEILDESGLIDASYLDGISSDISETFMELLEVEVQR